MWPGNFLLSEKNLVKFFKFLPPPLGNFAKNSRKSAKFLPGKPCDFRKIPRLGPTVQLPGKSLIFHCIMKKSSYPAFKLTTALRAALKGPLNQAIAAGMFNTHRLTSRVL